MHEAPRGKGLERKPLKPETDLRETLDSGVHPEFTVPLYQLRREMEAVQNTIASLKIPENKLSIGELKVHMEKLRTSLETTLRAFPEK